MSWTIDVEGLGYSYHNRPALINVSFTVRTGEVFGLLGPNGSGKTTIFRILSTLLRPDSGIVRVCGLDVSRDPNAVRSQIGIVFQSPSLDGKLTAEENLRHQGHLYGLRRTTLRQRVEQSLYQFRLSDRAHDRVETFSGGLKRRVEIAKSLLHRPSLLLLDEPSTGLDPGARRDMWTTLETMKRDSASSGSPLTIVMTTHLMDETEYCDSLGILDQGRLVVVDTPANLKARIGGDAISIQSRDPEKLCQAIQDRFGGEPMVLGDTVRVERESGHVFITKLVETFPGLITSVTVRQPTLEDAFIQLTGRDFEH